MSQGIADGTVGPWAREKLDALGAYLDFYAKVLKNQGHWCKSTTFVDAFAGAGTARVRRKAGPAPMTEAGLFEELESVSGHWNREEHGGLARCVIRSGHQSEVARHAFIVFA